MAKSLPSTTKLQEISRIITSNLHHHPKFTRPVSTTRVVPSSEPTKSKGIKLEPDKQKLIMDNNNNNNDNSCKIKSSPEIEERFPLGSVVNHCVRQWFLDTLHEAKAGDSTMQVLVGQMYNNGYGVTMNAQKGRAWIERASRSRSSARKVADKRPGYNASDSDSDNTKATKAADA